MADPPRASHLFLYAATVFVFISLVLFAIRFNSIVLDEYAHVPAGVSYLQVGRFSIYRETPPLIQALAGLPPFVAGAKLDYSKVSRGRCESAVGQGFMAGNGTRVLYLVRLARYVVLALGLACGILIFWWCYKLYGVGSAFCVASLWFLDPSVIAFSSLVTSDIGASAFCLAAAYYFFLFLEGPNLRRATLAGLALGFAQVTKFSMLALYPSWLALSMLSSSLPRPGRPHIPSRRLPTEVFWMFFISLVVINATYLFDGTFTPLGSFDFKSRSLTGEIKSKEDPTLYGNRFRGTVFSAFPVPLPRDYVLGLDSQKWDSDIGLTDVRDGHTASGGRWYSPLKTLFFKWPPGTLILVVTGALYWLAPARLRIFEGWLFWTAALSLLGLLFTQTGLNWPVRYALPIFPLLFLASGASVARLLASTAGRALVAGCLLWNVWELAWTSPLFLSYASPFVGGPTGAQPHLHGSNFDWGQDLFRLRQWYDGNPDKRPLLVTYFGPVRPEAVGIPMGGLPESFLAGERGEQEQAEGADRGRAFYWAVSSNLLNGVNGYFQFSNGGLRPAVIRSPALRPRNAIARIGYTIYVFRIDPVTASKDSPSLSMADLDGCLVGLGDRVWVDAVP